ncbi:MAG: hypothetical protein KGN84_11585, partial [Acidobacteriota bacterium]|nr:hypothetical protein [Acidobacteriota bacterium]
MAFFDRRWTATCPRCERTVTPEAVGLCKNCGRGEILGTPYKNNEKGLGCSNPKCEQVFVPYCPTCGAHIKDQTI